MVILMVILMVMGIAMVRANKSILIFLNFEKLNV